MTTELTNDEAYAVAGFIDSFIFDAFRSDCFKNLRTLVRAYEKCCKLSGYAGMSYSGMEEDDDAEIH